MFKNVNAKTVYKFIDGNDSLKSLERDRMGGVNIWNTHCELLNYYTIKEDGAIYSKVTLDMCRDSYESAGLGSYLEFSNWNAENVVMSSDFSLKTESIPSSVANVEKPAAIIFLPRIKNGIIIFMENKSDGFDVYFDYYLKSDKAMIGSYVVHKDKVFKPADRIEINQCIYIVDSENIEDLKEHYKAKTNEIVNVNPSHCDFMTFGSDSRIMMGSLGG